jgi:hypothetical protein
MVYRKLGEAMQRLVPLIMAVQHKLMSDDVDTGIDGDGDLNGGGDAEVDDDSVDVDGGVQEDSRRAAAASADV